MPNQTPDPSSQTQIRLDTEVFNKSHIYSNVAQEFIVTTDDKLRLCLIQYQAALRAKREWIAPISLLLPTVIAFTSVEFRPFLGLDAEIWGAIFLLATVGSFIWLVYTFIRALRTWWNQEGGVEQVVESLKRSSEKI